MGSHLPEVVRATPLTSPGRFSLSRDIGIPSVSAEENPEPHLQTARQGSRSGAPVTEQEVTAPDSGPRRGSGLASLRVGGGGEAGQVAGEQEEDVSRGKGHTLRQDNTPRTVLALLHVFSLSFLELHLLIRKEIHKWYTT